MPEIKKIDHTTLSFEEGGVRFFLLEGRDRALLIDSGMETRNARDLASRETTLPLELLNTHADVDHIGSNGQFERFYMSPAETVNYYRDPSRTGEIVPVWDGQIIDLGDRELEIISMPGHTPGSVAVLDVKNRRLFSGDPIQDGRIFMFGPMRELRAYIHSLRRLLERAGEFDLIYPSHGSSPVTPDLIPRLISGAEDILAGKVKGETGSAFGGRITVYDLGFAAFLCP